MRRRQSRYRNRRYGGVRRSNCIGAGRKMQKRAKNMRGARGRTSRGPKNRNTGIHYFRMRLDIDLTSADSKILWTPIIKVNEDWELSKQFWFYRIKLKFIPRWSPAQPDDLTANDELTTMWHTYLHWGETDYPSVKRMENARRVNMNGPYNFRIYDLTNTDMKSSNSGVDPDALRYMKLKIDNHCWREFKDEIDWYSMAFDFDDSISDD